MSHTHTPPPSTTGIQFTPDCDAILEEVHAVLEGAIGITQQVCVYACT